MFLLPLKAGPYLNISGSKVSMCVVIYVELAVLVRAFLSRNWCIFLNKKPLTNMSSRFTPIISNGNRWAKQITCATYDAYFTWILLEYMGLLFK